jgi:hypothetical protein
MSGIPFRFRVYIVVFLCVIAGGMIGLMAVEGFTPFDAFYFLIVTIATVGYGDIHPVTPAGKAVVIVIIICGVGCFIGLVANAIEYIIERREQDERLRKMNMLVGVFFSEIGTDMLRTFSAADPGIAGISGSLMISGTWSASDFEKAGSAVAGHTARLDSRNLDLPALHLFLSANKSLMVTMLENPYLIEHDAFTELMQALFHLTEELRVRDQLTDLPETDFAHLSGDINRVYIILIREWLVYMQHLKVHYPYLFSLAVRTNPFDKSASPVVK